MRTYCTACAVRCVPVFEFLHACLIHRSRVVARRLPQRTGRPVSGSARIVSKIGIYFSMISSVGFLTPSPRVTVVGGAHDQDAIVPSRGNPISPSLVSPTVSIRSWYKNQFHLIPLTPTPLLVRPLSKRLLYVFTKGLRQLVADLESTDDQPVVIQQYKDALVAKGKVCYEFWSDFGSAALTYRSLRGRWLCRKKWERLEKVPYLRQLATGGLASWALSLTTYPYLAYFVTSGYWKD